MGGKILDGKKISERIILKLRKQANGLNLKLGVVLVGKNPASKFYINQKKKVCQKIGVGFQLFAFPSKISNLELKEKITAIIKKPNISGLIIQLPLPKQIKTEEILNLVPPTKDVDILSALNAGRFYQGNFGIFPPTIAGIVEILKSYKIKIKGKIIVLVGGGKLVCKPLALWLLNKGATFSVVNKFTENISSFTEKADILISGVGKPNLIKPDMVKENVVIIDCGSSEVGGKIKGDVDFNNVLKKASYITPVPGGVGALTVVMLLSNLIRMSKR